METRRHRLYIAMTRAPEFLGMPRDYVLATMVTGFLPFLLTKSFWLLFGGLGLAYLIMRVIVFLDPHFLAIANVKLFRIGLMPNRDWFGGNSYEL